MMSAIPGKIRTKLYELTPRGRARKLLRAARRRALDSGLELDIDATWIEERLRGGECEATGLPLHPDSTQFTNTAPLAPSLDRHDPNIGYTKDNTMVVSWMYNRAKGEWGAGAVNTLARSLAKKIGERDA